MSIDGRGPSLNKAAENTIAALKSKNARLEERVATLTGVAQAHADDRDSYMERATELEQERDTARSIAVELEQQIAAIQSGIDDLHRLYERRGIDIAPDPLDAARDVIAAVENVLSLVTNTILNDLEEAEA
jgi:chromosome segregation ATPase